MWGWGESGGMSEWGRGAINYVRGGEGGGDNEICEGGEGAMESTCLGMRGEGRIEYEGVA